ncbi:hypothetical protein BGW80DRAFT_1249701 [Lactifluus volemus]|nr:hypothetical protein BGW80DRAFT_1249701 [Lactifluus volemus]
MVLPQRQNLVSVIVVALSAALISLTVPGGFAALALATGLLTLLTIIPMFIIDLYRQGAFVSYTVFEISSFSILWVLWLSSASYAAWADSQLTALLLGDSSCSIDLFGSGALSQGCSEIKAITAFSFLVWIYVGLILLALPNHGVHLHSPGAEHPAQGRGYSAWTAAVRDGTLLFPSEKSVENPVQVTVTAPPDTV